MKSSPILNIGKLLTKAPFRIAPERSEELSELKEKLNISFRINVDNPAGEGFYFRVDTDSGEIETSVASLEYLWTAVQLHYVYCIRYSMHLEAGVDSFDWASDSSVHPATQQFRSASDNLSSDT